MPEFVVFFTIIVVLYIQPPTAGYGLKPALELTVSVEMAIKLDPQNTQ